MPQRTADPNGVSQYRTDNPDLYPILDHLQLFDVYSSAWFSAIYILLFISLIGCVLPRAVKHAKDWRAKPPRTPRRLERLEAHDALVAADFHAAHVAEEHGGVGADALAVSIIIEEVARVCASSSLIPAVNKLGSMPVILGGSDEINTRYMPRLASGEAFFSYGLSEREAGSDTAAMRTRARREGDDWILKGSKAWISTAGVSELYTVLAVTDPDLAARLDDWRAHLEAAGVAIEADFRWPNGRRSVYFRTLVHDPGSLGERGALFTKVMYAPKWLPRAERD